MPKKILVVDDEPNVLKLIALRLEANNYEVVTALDGFYAIKKAHDENPDLIILDICMPAGGGISVFDNLRANNSTMMIPVIFITAHPNEDIWREVMEKGAEGFITKPFNADDLLAKVKKVLKEDVGNAEKK